MDLLIRHSYRVVVTARPDIVVVQYRFHSSPCKTASENSWKQFERSNGRIYSYGPFDRVLVSSRWYGPTGHRRRAVPIPRYSMENSLWKVVQTILERSTVGSIVMDLWIGYSYRVGGTARPDIVVAQYRFHATPCKTTSGNSWKQF